MTYREWMVTKARGKDPESLRDYIHEVPGDEGWNSEFKLSTTSLDYGVREAVASLANARGGEVFVGVDDDGKVDGTEVTEQAMNEVLRQRDLRSEPWYVSDLLQVIRATTVVPFPTVERWAYVLEIRERERPAFVFAAGGRRDLPVRSGSDTLLSDSLASIEWYRQVSRGMILRGCYEELSNYMGQISAFRGVPDGLPDRLPFLSSILADPTQRRMLTEDDVVSLIGKGIGGGRYGGASDLYYKVLRRSGVALQGKPAYARNIRLVDLEGLGTEFANVDYEVKQALGTLAAYIRSQGFEV